MSYILQFIDKGLWQGYAQGLWQANCQILCKYKYGRDDKKCETCRIEYKYSGCFLKYTSFKNDLIEYKYLYCNKNYKEKFNEKLKSNCLIHTHFLFTTIINYIEEISIKSDVKKIK